MTLNKKAFSKYFLYLFSILSLNVVTAFGAISVTQNVPMSVTNSFVSSKTISVTANTGDNFLAVVQTGHCPPTSATYNGIPLTMATSGAPLGSAYQAVYYMYDPPIGTHDLIVNQNTSGCSYAYLTVGASLMSGVSDTYTPLVSIGSDGSSPYSIALNAPDVNSFIWFGSINNAGATMTAGSGWVVGAQPEVLAFGSWYGYTSTLTNTNPWYTSYTASAGTMSVYSMTLQAGSGGGGGSTTTPTAITEIVVPATIYSSVLVKDPYIATTSYSFLSTSASSSLKQAGLIYITHQSSSTPTVSWGGQSMTYLDSTLAISGYKTSLYVLSSPASQSNIIVTGISSSSVKYISESVWSNANIRPSFDSYVVVNDSSKASVALPTLVTPSALITSMFTVSGFSSFSLLPDNQEQQKATSSTGSFALVSSLCSSALDDCSVGYKKNFSIFDTANGQLLAIAMYATTTKNIVYGPNLSDIVGGLGTDTGFATCIDEGVVGGLICVGKNLLFWVLGLLVPSSGDMVEIRDVFYQTITSSSSLISSLFLVPVAFTQWTSTSSVPDYDKLEIHVPVFDKTWVLDPETATETDNSVHDMLEWMLGTFMVLFIGYKFWKFI